MRTFGAGVSRKMVEGMKFEVLVLVLRARVMVAVGYILR